MQVRTCPGLENPPLSNLATHHPFKKLLLLQFLGIPAHHRTVLIFCKCFHANTHLDFKADAPSRHAYIKQPYKQAYKKQNWDQKEQMPETQSQRK